jgi:hypothetical protein
LARRYPTVNATHSRQLGLALNFFKRFDSDVGLVEADTYQLALDPHSLAVTENRTAEAIQYEKEIGQFGRITCHLEPSAIAGNLDQTALARPCPVDSHHPNVKRRLELNARLALSALVAIDHHANLPGFRRFRQQIEGDARD